MDYIHDTVLLIVYDMLMTYVNVELTIFASSAT